MRTWLKRLGVKTLFITPGSPWENVYNESFNGTLGDQVLKREIFYTLREARYIIEEWSKEYNRIRAPQRARVRATGPRDRGALDGPGRVA